MVGIGYEYNGKWIYKTFLMNEKHEDSELEMFRGFYKYINTILAQFKKSKAKFYHWSFAEPCAYNNFKKRHSNSNFNDSNYKFYDLYQVFLSEPVVVKGALNFSLKTIGKAMHKLNLIKTIWPIDSVVSDGLDAMYEAYKIYLNSNKKIIFTQMKQIIKYNHIDCKIMWDILNTLNKIA
jgi:predicted RecB family nuclease